MPVYLFAFQGYYESITIVVKLQEWSIGLPVSCFR